MVWCCRKDIRAGHRSSVGKAVGSSAGERRRRQRQPCRSAHGSACRGTTAYLRHWLTDQRCCTGQGNTGATERNESGAHRASQATALI